MSRRDWYVKLRTGEGLRDGWAGIMSLTNGLMAARIPETSIRSHLLEPSNEGARYVNFDSKGRSRPSSTRERMAREAIRKTRVRQSSTSSIRDRAEAVARLVEIQERIDRDPVRWKGRAGANDRAVVLAGLELAIRRGGFEFGASVREMADEANIGEKGAHASLRRVRDWFELVTLGRGTLGSVFRVRPEAGGTEGNPLCPPEGTEPEGCAGFLRSDLWRHEGLGKTTARYYAMLTDEPRSAAELAEYFGVQPRTASKHLSKLKHWELAYWQGDYPQGWSRTSTDPAEVEEKLGVAGRGEDQRERHHARAQFRARALRNRGQRTEIHRVPTATLGVTCMWWRSPREVVHAS